MATLAKVGEVSSIAIADTRSCFTVTRLGPPEKARSMRSVSGIIQITRKWIADSLCPNGASAEADLGCPKTGRMRDARGDRRSAPARAAVHRDRLHVLLGDRRIWPAPTTDLKDV